MTLSIPPLFFSLSCYLFRFFFYFSYLTLPFLSGLAIYNYGAITASHAFHTYDRIFPLFFTSLRTYHSARHPGALCGYTCSVRAKTKRMKKKKRQGVRNKRGQKKDAPCRRYRMRKKK